MKPKNVIEVLVSQADANCLKSQNQYIKGGIRCPSEITGCKECIWSLGDPVNIHLIEIVDILEVEDVS